MQTADAVSCKVICDDERTGMSAEREKRICEQKNKFKIILAWSVGNGVKQKKKNGLEAL